MKTQHFLAKVPFTPWAMLLTIVMLLPIAQARAQLVTVPMNCNVVVAGTGGATGFGGKVGDGGIVTMPDPSGTGNIFTLAGVAPIKWSLLGDLSIEAAITPPTAPVASAGAVTAVKIISYNKNLRTPSEVGTPSTNARSKGRVNIEYTQGACNNKMSFDIYKVWGDPAATSYPNTKYAPPIVGPNCWGTGLITFSVDQVSSDNALDAIGFDQYYWKITNGANVDLIANYPALAYTSADASSITIIQGGTDWTSWFTGGPYTLKVCYGRANPWDGGTLLSQSTTGVTCVTKIIQNPLVPAYAGGFPTCVNAVAPALPITITSSNPTPGYTYTWSRSNWAWPLTPSGTYGSGLTIGTIGDMNPCTYTLTVTGPCGSSTYNYTINRTYNGNGLLASAPPYCTSTGSNVLTVDLAGTAQGNRTCWGSLPSGWSASNPPGIPSAVRFTIPAGAAGTTSTVNLYNCDCAGTVLPITINVKPGTPVLSATPVCVPSGGGTNQTWTATSAGANATSYVWSNTMGMIQVAPTNDATGVFTPTGTINGNISVYTANVASCPSVTTTKILNRNAVAPVVVQPSCYTLGYSCASVPGLAGSSSFTIDPTNFTQNGTGTYTWTFPGNTFFNSTGTAVIVTQSTNAAVVRPTTGVPNSGVSGYYGFTVAFAPSTGCAGSSTTVTINGNLGTVFYTNNGTGPGTVGTLYPPPGLPGGSTYMAYDCSIPGTYGSVYSGGTGIPLNTVIPVNSGSLTTQITVPGGCTWRPAPAVTSHKSLVVVDEDGEEVQPGRGPNDGITVMPNPNDGTFILHLRATFDKGSVLLLDAAGKQVGTPQHIVQGENTLNYTHLPPGQYILRMVLDGNTRIQRIVVTDLK